MFLLQNNFFWNIPNPEIWRKRLLLIMKKVWSLISVVHLKRLKTNSSCESQLPHAIKLLSGSSFLTFIKMPPCPARRIIATNRHGRFKTIRSISVVINNAYKNALLEMFMGLFVSTFSWTPFRRLDLLCKAEKISGSEKNNVGISSPSCIFSILFTLYSFN